MAHQEFERDEVRDRSDGRRPEQSENAEAKEFEWASAVGNAAVQQIAGSPAGRTTPVRVGATPLSARALARQAEEEEEGGEGAVATAPPEPAGAESATPAAAIPEAEAAGPEGEGATPEAEAAAPEGEGATPEAEAAESAAPEAAAEATPEEETE
jgi:hypothetical protein